jgi:putative ABC transport system ATP-binding protein
MLEMRQVSKIYRTAMVETHALRSLDLHVRDGEFVAVTGPSGSGKTTFLNIAGLLETYSSGQYLLDGEDVSHLDDSARSRLRNRKIGFIFQSFNLIDELTVFENVELPLIYTKVGSKERKERVDEVLEKMNMMHRRNHFPQQLSGGQQQRVAVARAIVNHPKLILADEPTGNLDSSNGDDVMKTLVHLNQEGATILMVTHSQYCAEFGNRIIRMLDGQVVTENVVQQYM